MATWALFTRNEFRRASGGIPAVNADVVVRRLATGAFVVEAAYTPDRWRRLPASAGLIIRRDGHTLLSGAWTRRSWRPADTSSAGLMYLEGISDDAIGQYRLAVPDPALALDGQNVTGAADVWSMTGPVESVMHALVALNAGPAARPERRVPGLVMALDGGRGPTVTWKTLRYPTVQSELERLALRAERAGVRLLPRFEQTDDGLAFGVVEADDRTGRVVFGAGLGNLDDQEYIEDAGTVGLAVAGGQGAGAARHQEVVVTADAFTKAFGVLPEVYIDRRETDDDVELTEAAQEAVSGGMAKVSYRGVALDTPGTRYGRDFDLNTLATVKAGPGGTDPATGRLYEPLASFDDLVREIHFEKDFEAGTEKITVAVGSEGASTQVITPLLSKIAAANARLAKLERSP